jgi:hypothetical protein
MNKALIGLILGAVLGALDGAAAGFYPKVREVEGKLLFIILASTFKGLVAGVITGFLARKWRSLPLGMLVGLVVAALITFPIAIQYDPDLQTTPFWEIMIPGAICGMIVGFATQRYGRAEPTKAAATAAALALGLGLSSCASEARVEPAGLDAQRAFARMKLLAGEYEAAIAGEADVTSRVTYEVTAGGHALLETLNDAGEPEMVSIYYLDGEDLVLAHYCAIGNRPHLRLDRAASTIDDLRFEWDGTATDIDPAKDPHIHAARFRFPDAETTESGWTFWQEGMESHVKTFVMSRAAPPAAPAPEPAPTTPPADPAVEE